LAGENGVEYAQKIYRVPVRSSSKETYLKAINNEVEAIRKLKPDPHIVRIECTYTEQRTFVVVLSPRADEDLQSYLERQNHATECPKDWRCKCPLHALAAIAAIESNQAGIQIRSWFYCLASALAGIHQQGVRHKDIKSRNILLKGSQLLYADFGSSRIFESELTRAITGTVNSGNTPMYSAPEVMQNQKRGRSADIFSLGCVFTEMLNIKGGKSLAEYHEFRKSTFIDQWGSSYETCAYHKTLGKVDEWFDASPTTFPEYRAFILPMLDVDRLQRPTAEATALAIRDFYRDLASTTCEACGKHSPIIEAIKMILTLKDVSWKLRGSSLVKKP
jgi:serine/threonine protein kinase